MPYQSSPKSDGSLRIQGLSYFFESSSPIIIKAVVGEKYYNPDTGKYGKHSGQQESDPITLQAILSPDQFLELNDLYTSPTGSSGTLVAIHRQGGIKTTLTGVRLEYLEYGERDVASNDAAKISLRLSFDDSVVEREI